jgi:hypothetical protein
MVPFLIPVEVFMLLPVSVECDFCGGSLHDATSLELVANGREVFCGEPCYLAFHEESKSLPVFSGDVVAL